MRVLILARMALMLAGCVTVNVSTGSGAASSAQESKANADTDVSAPLTDGTKSVTVK